MESTYLSNSKGTAPEISRSGEPMDTIPRNNVILL